MHNKNEINLSTLYGLGFKTSFPGTVASFLTLLLTYLLMLYDNLFLFFVILLTFFVFGYFSTLKYLSVVDNHDPSEVVIDEVVGQLVALLFFPLIIFFKEIKFDFLNIIFYFILAFMLFRFFDILKPWPISFFDKKRGIFWIFFDDILAGVFTSAIGYVIVEWSAK